MYKHEKNDRIMELLRQGKTYREISRECQVSNQTIQNIKDQMNSFDAQERVWQKVGLTEMEMQFLRGLLHREANLKYAKMMAQSIDYKLELVP